MGRFSTIDAKDAVKEKKNNTESVNKELFISIILDGSIQCHPQKILRDLYRSGHKMEIDLSKPIVIGFSGNENTQISPSPNANIENNLVIHRTIIVDMTINKQYADRVKAVREQINILAEEYYISPNVSSLKVHLFLFFYKQGDPAVNLMDSLDPLDEEDAKKKIKDLFNKPILKHRKVKYQGIEYIGSFDHVGEVTYFDNTINLLSDKDAPSKQDVLDAAVMCHFTYETQTDSDSSVINVVVSKIKSLFSKPTKIVKTSKDHILNNKRKDIGWKMMSENEVRTLTAFDNNFKLKSGASGLFSQLFYKVDSAIGNVGNVKYAYCTAGTNVTSIADWFSNISQGLIGWAPQYVQSVKNAKILDKALSNNTLFFIGHSLGGGLASNNALVTSRRHAITFNAAGLNVLRVKATLLINNRGDLFRIEERRKRIHPYIIRGEILHVILGFLGQKPYGYDKEHSFVKDETSLIDKIRSTIDRHGLDKFIKDVEFQDTLNTNYGKYLA